MQGLPAALAARESSRQPQAARELQERLRQAPRRVRVQAGVRFPAQALAAGRPTA